MTEAEWIVCGDPHKMIDYLQWKPGERNLQLFAIACCHRTGVRLTSADLALFEEVERGCDREPRKGRHPKPRIFTDVWPVTTRDMARRLAHFAVLSVASGDCPLGIAQAARAGAFLRIDNSLDVGTAPFAQAETREAQQQSNLLRHLVCNPFRPYPAPAAWPVAVIDLAQAMYGGQDNRLILGDALEETGYADLADHFRKESCHPKGCWVLDMILGKK